MHEKFDELMDLYPIGRGVMPRNLNGDDPVAQIEAGITESVYYLHTDHLMTPRFATDASSEVVWRWEGARPFLEIFNLSDETPTIKWEP